MTEAARFFPGVLLATALMAAFAGGPARADHALVKPKLQGADWVGLYGGVTAGGVVPTGTGERFQGVGGAPTQPDFVARSLSSTGFTGGVHIGYNWAIDKFVYGAEAEMNFIGGRHAPDGFGAAPGAPFFLAYGPSGQFFGGFRARAGYSIGRWLPYVTAGVVTGGARGPATLIYRAPGVDPNFSADYSQSSRMKFTVGGGLAYAFMDSWSARAEYLFLDQSLNNQLFSNAPGTTFLSRMRDQAHVVRFGLDYHFGSENEIKDPATAAATPDEHGDHHDHQHGGAEDKDHSGDAGGDKPEAPRQEFYSVHGQTTHVLQGYPRFRGFYNGANSFPWQGQVREGSTTDLFVGVRLWENGAVFVNPEIDQGFGLANGVGPAAYVDNAVPKIGRAAPYLRFQRYFFRQIIGLGDGGAAAHDPDEGSRNEVLEATQNQLAGKVSKDRLIFTIGKLAVSDVFDDNVYAHDATTGFLNFAFNTHGSMDYAGDTWGYTHGAALEWKQNWWTARGGLFQLSREPNSQVIEQSLMRQFMAATELEARYEAFGQPGAVKLLLWGDDGYMANLDEATRFALLAGNLPPTPQPVRKRHLKTGGGINIKQQIIDNFGFFVRANMADPRYETFDNTDVDRQISAGVVAGGKWWSRPKDEIGLALAFSGIGGARIRYHQAGGIGVYIGDGALNYGGESVMEAYYKLGVRDGIDLTFDYQFVDNPAYNRDRGPINVFGLRMHAQF